MNFKKLLEKLFEALIYTSGTLTTIIVLFIVYFLFKEGSGILGKSLVEEGYAIAVNPNNPVNAIDPFKIRKIFEKEVTNWNELGGENEPVKIFTLSEVENTFTAEELGASFENLGPKIQEYIKNNRSIIAYFPEKYLIGDTKLIEVTKVNFLDLLKGTDWFPTATPSPQLGMLPIILGSLMVSFFAILFALPVGIIVAVYLAELAGENLKNVIKTVIELLAGIPSVVYGFFGLVVLVPFVKDTFNLEVGESALAGSILLAIIALPTIISLSEDAISATPRELKAASLAVGANHLQTILNVSIPYGFSGIVSATILGIGRAFGETMAVLMVCGNAAVMPNLFQPVRTITATIAAELGEAPTGGIHYQSLFILGVFLFFFTFCINLLAGFIASKNER